ncbi:phosphotriesterase family protein [Gluconacetobacter liquefaciens]|uniref:phosphotriesterase family protein n=1 Tax=Gluconacetobacter liquefaciens TaxID=89584 RepID=UPI001C3FF10D|nr:hypothetical protein [Gluconacetobacter liquefaciens]
MFLFLPHSDEVAMSRGFIQTVLGSIAPECLGPTLMHEHLIIDLNSPAQRAKVENYGALSRKDIDPKDNFKLNWGQKRDIANFRLCDEGVAIDELREMRAAGGMALVELTVGGLGPDPLALKRIAEASGVHVVMGCGHYVDAYQDPDNASRPVESFAREIVGQVATGAWGTDIKAGIIGEIGCEYPWKDVERRVLLGAILAQNETGAALTIHPGRHENQPMEIVGFLREHGADISRSIICHLDRTIFDIETLLRLADTGCILEFDLFGWENACYWPNLDIDLPNDADRLRLVKALLERGYGDQILLSHDICVKSRLLRYGGHGYQHMFANIVPLMQRREIADADIDRILTLNPRRLLTQPGR